MSFKEKEHLDLETSESFTDKKTACPRVSAWSSKENNPPKSTAPQLVENVEYEFLATRNTEYLQDGWRYEEPDDSLYLGEEDYLESFGYSEDAETTVEEEAYDDTECLVYYGEEDSMYSENGEFSDEQHSEDSETGVLLEKEEEKSAEERKKVFEDVLACLNLDRSRKLLPDFVKQFSLDRGCGWVPKTMGDLAWNFLMKVQALDMTARDSILRHKILGNESEEEFLTGIENLEIRETETINPLDVLCASMLCSDSSLQREVMSNMYQCQFALPLLLPDAENNKSILMLGAMKDIMKEQSTQPSGGPTEGTEKLLTLMKMPVISFVRLGYCSFSKSRILNTLLSPAHLKSHKVFLHQDLPVLVLPRQISDGLVEITWCFPDSDGLKENSSFFQKPVAVANLRGDLKSFWTQFGFLMEVSSAVFFFTDSLGEKEWNLLMFLGEAAIERCYFVLSPQAKESEEAQIFQRILNLKPTQLLFWEEEEAEEKGRNMEGLQAALQEVMAASLRCVSVEDMASLARELGIQVDQDFENIQGIQISPSEDLAGIAEDEGQQRYSQPKSSSESPAETSRREPGAGGEINQNLQNFHTPPVFMFHPKNPCPLPTRTGGHFNPVSLKAPWVMGSHFWTEQRPQWFYPFPFQNTRACSPGKNLGIQYFQPQRLYSGERFMKFSRKLRGCHAGRTFGRPPRPRCAQAWPERPQVKYSTYKPSQPVFSQPKHTQTKPAQSQSTPAQCSLSKPTQPKLYKPQSHQPKPSQLQSSQAKTSQPQSSQHKPSQLEPSQAKPSSSKPTQPKLYRPQSHQPKPSQPQSSQAKPSPSKPTQPNSFKPQSSQSKPSQPLSSQAKPSPSKPTQPKPYKPQSSQAKPSQPRCTQPKSSQTSPSQAKAYSPRAGPKSVGKH
uniref:Caspase recruitment domain-containing protein 6 n=2 Tax=Sus scrofa TaxID=9823 RepID=A0A480IZP3_PIG